MNRILIVVGLALGLASCDKLVTQNDESRRRIAEAAQIEAQAKANEASSLANVELNKRITTLQLAVIEVCVKRGMIPVFMGMNVDCKAVPTAARAEK